MKQVLFIFLFVFVSASQTLAADRGAQAGLAGGLSALDADNTKPFNLMGIKGSVYLLNSFTVGGYYLNSDSSGEGTPTETFKYSLLGLEAAYHFATSGGDGFMAVRAGLTKVTNSNPAGTQIIYSPYHYGVAAGYDYAFLNWATVGFEGSFLRVFDGKTSLSGTVYERNAFNIISFLLSLQIKI